MAAKGDRILLINQKKRTLIKLYVACYKYEHNMEAYVVNRSCLGCSALSTFGNANMVCDRISKNSPATSIHQYDNSDDIKCLIQLYKSIPDYRDINHLSELEFYNTLELLKKTSKELRMSTNAHMAACHSHISLPTFCSIKKLKSKKKRNRKSILASSLNVLPSKDCHEIPKPQIKDMKLHKNSSIKEKRESEVNGMKGLENVSLTDDEAVAYKQEEAGVTDLLRESFSTTPASTKSRTPEILRDVRKDDLTNHYTNTSPESKKRLRKEAITQQGSTNPRENKHERTIEENVHNTAKNKNRLKDTSMSSTYLATRPNLAATLRLECGKKKIKELTNDFHYPDRSGISSSLFDWEIRKSPSWKALTLNESHKKLLAVKLATRKAEQSLLKREYELNMEIMHQRVKSAPLLFERTNYWTMNVGKIKHNCQNIDNAPHHEDHHFRKGGDSCYSLKRKNKCRCSRFLKSNETDLESRLNSIQLSEPKCSTNLVKNIQNNCNNIGKIHSLPIKCPYYQDTSNYNTKSKSNPKSKSNRKKLLQSSPLLATMNVNDSGDDLSSLDKAYL